MSRECGSHLFASQEHTTLVPPFPRLRHTAAPFREFRQRQRQLQTICVRLRSSVAEKIFQTMEPIGGMELPLDD